MVSIKNFIRASRLNIESAQRMLAEPKYLKAEAKRVTGDGRKTGWLRRDARSLLKQCAEAGVTTKKPYLVSHKAGGKMLLTVWWPASAAGEVLVPAKFCPA